MSLVRAWRRQISGASAAALVVPVALFGSMVLLALTGGFGALGGLGQAIAGPATPSGGPHDRTVAANNAPSAPAALLPVVARASAPALVASVSPPRGTLGSSHGSTGGGQHPGNGPGSTGVLTAPTTTTPSPSPPSPTGPPVTQPSPPPPTLTDGVVTLGTSITSKIPGPLGQLATATLKSVGQTLDKTLPGNTRAAVSNVAGAVDSTVSQLGSGVSGVVNGLHLP